MTANTPETHDSLPELIRLLEEQKELIERLGGLAGRQGALIEAGHTEALLELLSQRQRIMDRFVISQDGLSRLTETLRAAGDLAETSRSRIGGLVEDISQQLAEILRLDDRDRETLQAGRDRLGEELSGLGAARQARAAYLKSRSVSNRFADREV